MSMAGTIVSKYKCDLEAWKSFEDKLKAASLHMEMDGSLDTHIFFDIKEVKNGPHGVFLTAKVKHDVEMQKCIDVKLSWIVKNPGTKPFSSFEVASQIEGLIFESGGICYYSPVQKVLKRK